MVSLKAALTVVLRDERIVSNMLGILIIPYYNRSLLSLCPLLPLSPSPDIISTVPSSVVAEEGAHAAQVSTIHAKMVGKELLKNLVHVKEGLGEDMYSGYLDRVEQFLASISS